MKLRTAILLLGTHVLTGVAGFALGIYLLPIFIAPPAPTGEQVKAVASGAAFSAQFRRDLKGSDAFHWGEGTVAVGAKGISLMGKLAPGPDYKLYLSPEYVETKDDFLRVKPKMVRVGDVKTFENFVVDVPAGVDPAAYSTVVVWCETFGAFITAAKYR